MPVKLRLIMDPVISDKNVKLQRKCENICKILDKDLKSTKRKINKDAENCVQSLYTLMLEAEEHENDRNSHQNDSRHSSPRVPSIYAEDVENDKTKTSSAVRPITATGYGTRSSDKTASSRPFSAHPSLLTKEATEEVKLGREAKRKSVQLEDTHSFSQILSAWEKDKPGSLYKDRRLYWDMPIYTDQKTQKKSQFMNTDSKDTDSREASSLVKPSRYVKKHRSPTHSLENLSEIDSVDFDAGTSKEKQRPKTAADYRRKQPDDEVSQYWKRRVNRLIHKWDTEDSEDYFQNTHSKSDTGLEKVKLRQCSITMPEKTQLGEAARRKQQFMQTYGSRYKFALNVDSSVPVIQNKYKRPVIVTRQELASIHADLAKRRKQTRQILTKSKRIVTAMAKLSGAK